MRVFDRVVGQSLAVEGEGQADEVSVRERGVSVGPAERDRLEVKRDLTRMGREVSESAVQPHPPAVNKAWVAEKLALPEVSALLALVDQLSIEQVEALGERYDACRTDDEMRQHRFASLGVAGVPSTYGENTGCAFMRAIEGPVRTRCSQLGADDLAAVRAAALASQAAWAYVFRDFRQNSQHPLADEYFDDLTRDWRDVAQTRSARRAL
jgi:hypothetical protein